MDYYLNKRMTRYMIHLKGVNRTHKDSYSDSIMFVLRGDSFTVTVGFIQSIIRSA